MARTPSLWERWNCWMASTSLGQTILSSPFQAQDDLLTKSARIETCLAQSPVDLWELRELALSKGGLLTPAFRQRAWPLLVGLSNDISSSPSDDENSRGSSSRSLAPSTTSGRPPLYSAAALADSTNKMMNQPFDLPDEKKSDGYDASIDLIRRDVNRSVVFRYNTSSDGNDMATPSYASERLAQALENTIRMAPFPRKNAGVILPSTAQQPQCYHYYQGLHDVAGVVLHHLDYQADLGTFILQRLAQSHWRDALRENFGNLAWIINHLFLPLVEKVDANVHYQLQVAQVEMSNLILPWMITWFTHDIFQADTAGRLVDAFVSSHPMLPLYLSVSLLTHPQLKNLILESDPNDPASLFVTMKQLPKYIASEISSELSGNFVVGQDLLDDALELLHQYPPRSLLDLVDEDVMSRSLVVQRANSINMFQSVRSWTVSSPSVMSPLGPFQGTYTRAKLASGVPLLIDTVGSDWMIHRQRIRQQRFQASGRKPLSKLQKLKQLLLGNVSK